MNPLHLERLIHMIHYHILLVCRMRKLNLLHAWTLINLSTSWYVPYGGLSRWPNIVEGRNILVRISECGMLSIGIIITIFACCGSYMLVFSPFHFMLISDTWHMLISSCHPQIPNWLEGDQSGSTKDNPFPLPETYLASKQKNVCLSNFYVIQVFVDIVLIICFVELAGQKLGWSKENIERISTWGEQETRTV